MSMIEKMAQEIYASTWSPGDKADWKKVDIARKQARAALEALREPTDEMIRAGRLKMPAEARYWQDAGMMHCELLSQSECTQPETILQAMVDAALKEGE